MFALYRKYLYDACLIYDSSLLLQVDSRKAWKGGFRTGAGWMHEALRMIRKKNIPALPRHYNFFGLFKYGISFLITLAFLYSIILYQIYILIPLSILIFYTVESQFVFLFPLAMDRDPYPLLKSLYVPIKGGRLLAIPGVMYIAFFMVTGLLTKKGIIRSWSAGCLAVLLWYEDSRNNT